jgi:ankyrin repeat protein
MVPIPTLVIISAGLHSIWYHKAGSWRNHLEIARLVNFGADVNVTNDKGYTPLHEAARSGYREIAKLLLGSGASLDARTVVQTSIPETSTALFHYTRRHDGNMLSRTPIARLRLRRERT